MFAIHLLLEPFFDQTKVTSTPEDGRTWTHESSPNRSGPVRSGRAVGRAPSGHDPLGNFRVVIRRRMGQNTRVFIFYTVYAYRRCAMCRRPSGTHPVAD